MGSEQQNPLPPKRPFCHRCIKPLRLCLCRRLKSPPLDNSIPVTILQHSLEKNHPLNSTRVAALGLKNLAVVPITDVNFHAHFLIRPIDPNQSDSKAHFDLDANGESVAGVFVDKYGESFDFQHNQACRTVVVNGGCCNVKKDSEESLDFATTHLAVSDDGDSGGCGNGSCLSHLEHHDKPWKKSKSIKIQSGCLDLGHSQDRGEAIFDKYRVVASFTDLKVTIERTAKPDISWVLETPIGRAVTANGFTVKKLQRKQLRGNEEFRDFEEFTLQMPPGAALLFPSGKSAISLNEVDFEVKHLVVLDGTWGKAQRMYHENPWLKLLPHIKLDLGRESLYSEVRHQPKAGCLSTIESIVCALKELGNYMEGLDELLDVFESMIEDQRRCKDEKFRGKSMS